ncbi:KAP family P-loop NTPase fold protein [Actinomyces ruminicola]|uniref:KAP family P-loop domain-containing protein n=1 Tax=Actinomyces ruminicola TaxID=332524 RepID=A0A1G9VHU4_9ACTO|nr:P-loop NTPase fold protein [Actinomyces ruminicola]SDM71680.1 KAP family P-loop domain-containing protein [Actinomyces ruminicola]
MNGTEPPLEKPPVDIPITSSAEDVLGRAPVAHEFAESIRELDASRGLVVGVLGAWGHGKSSFINLMREQFATDPALTVVDFNPWMFSGSNQLVNFFFTEIGAQLRIRDQSLFGKTEKHLARYAQVFTPAFELIPFPGAAAVGKIAMGIWSRRANRERSAKKMRDEITNELAKLPRPIVVVIDDIDRLTTPEIREIFKLVRLTASFPNIVYVLAFDRARVEQALSEDGIPGRVYLEKIVQLIFDVPQAPQKLLRSQVLEVLDRIVQPITNTELDGSRWADVYSEVIEPLISNMRDVTRYAISARPTIRALGEEVDLVDLLALEALRVFRPELFWRLLRLRNELTSVHAVWRRESVHESKGVTTLLAAFSDDDKLIRALFRHVFPPALQHIENGSDGSDRVDGWRAAHRMAHADFLNLYIDRFASDRLVVFRNSERAFELLSDAVALNKHLMELEPKRLEGVIEGLASYEGKFKTEMVVPASITLLNLIDCIPENKQRGRFDFGGGDVVVGRIVVRLLRSVENEAERETLVSQILDGVETFSSQLCLILDLGRREGIGRKLVSEAFAGRILKNFVERLQGVSPPEPSREWDAWRIYDAVQAETGELPLKPDDDPALLRAVLHSLKSTARSQSVGSRQVRYEDYLGWKRLVQLLGSESAVKATVDSIREALGDDEVLRLADRYLSGWRPKLF